MQRERERGLSRERDVPAALKISHDVQKRLVHVALVAREPQFNRSHVHQRIVGGLRVLLRGMLGSEEDARTPLGIEVCPPLSDWRGPGSAGLGRHGRQSRSGGKA